MYHADVPSKVDKNNTASKGFATDPPSCAPNNEALAAKKMSKTGLRIANTKDCINVAGTTWGIQRP
jgi:hypothetical protein